MRQELGLTGKGVGVAVIDSGISDSHDDLYRTRPGASRLRTGGSRISRTSQSTTRDCGRPTEPSTTTGMAHTSRASSRAPVTTRTVSTRIAPGAKLVGLKVTDGLGRGYISDVIAAINYAISVKATYNIRVINLSVAAGYTSPIGPTR